MNKKSVTVVINDPNRFFAEGLMHYIRDHCKNTGLQVEFTDCIFNNQAKLVFLAEDSVSVASTHYLNQRITAHALTVFTLHDALPRENPPSPRSTQCALYTPLYRKQPVEDFASIIQRHLGPQSDLRSILAAPCSTRQRHAFTRRETEILRYLARGISNGAVARFLKISEKTVSAHKRNIMSKLNMIRPAELNYWLLQEGWCESWRTREK